MEKLRLDKYLWAVRIFKTRSQAATACDQGKVKKDGLPVKASRAVTVGEQYTIKTAARKWVILVIELLDQRVQYQEAIKFYTDLTPESDQQHNQRQVASFYTGKRQSKTGRPTKKQRRDWDDYRKSSS